MNDYIYKPDTCISKAFVKCNGQDRVAQLLSLKFMYLTLFVTANMWKLIHSHINYSQLKYRVLDSMVAKFHTSGL